MAMGLVREVADVKTGSSSLRFFQSVYTCVTSERHLTASASRKLVTGSRRMLAPPTTKLAAFHSNETSKDKLSIIYHWLSIIAIHVHAKLHKNLSISTCSLH